MAELSDLINFALDKNPVDFATAFNEIVTARCADAVDAKRVDLATSVYGQPEEDEWDITTDLEDLDDEA